MKIRRFLLAFIGGALCIAAVAVAGFTFLKSYNDYKAYEKEYNEGVDAIKAKFPVLPKKVFIDDDYVSYSADGESVDQSKSEFEKDYLFYAEDAFVKPLSEAKKQEYKKIAGDDTPLGTYMTGLDRMGGEITFSFETENHGMSDICLAIRTNYIDSQGVYHKLENITDYIKIQVNRLDLKTENLALSEDRDDFHELVFQDTFLIKGTNTITLTTSAYNGLDTKDDVLYVMPDIRNMTVLTDVNLTKNVPETEEA